MDNGTFEVLCANPQFWLQNVTGYGRLMGLISGANLTIQSEDPTSMDVVNWMVVAERQDSFIKEWDRTDGEGYLVTQYGDASVPTPL